MRGNERMVKCLTINVHAWMEAEPLKKLVDLAEHILAEKYDLICLQEVNQLMESKAARELLAYQEIPGTPCIHQDNFALLLVKYLEKQGQSYYWSWAYNHIGYDKYHEGVAILSKKAISVSDILVSETSDPADYHTRRVLLAKTCLDGQDVAVCSLHLSWFGKGFEGEWAKLEAELSRLDLPLLLLGDFNNPTDLEGYQLMMASDLNLQDSHKVAQHVYGDHSIVADIDGWENNQESYKVDHALLSPQVHVRSSQIVFDGGASPVISDHYGLEIDVRF